jgi:hypothetical protein
LSGHSRLLCLRPAVRSASTTASATTTAARSDQCILTYGTAGTVVGDALAVGDQDKIGDALRRLRSTSLPQPVSTPNASGSRSNLSPQPKPATPTAYSPALMRNASQWRGCRDLGCGQRVHGAARA